MKKEKRRRKDDRRGRKEGTRAWWVFVLIRRALQQIVPQWSVTESSQSYYLRDILILLVFFIQQNFIFETYVFLVISFKYFYGVFVVFKVTLPKERSIAQYIENQVEIPIFRSLLLIPYLCFLTLFIFYEPFKYF